VSSANFAPGIESVRISFKIRNLAVQRSHGGAGAAAFAADHMISFIEKTKEWNDYVHGGCASTELLGEALKKAFINIDDALRQHQENGQDASGCTSVTAMITPQYIICANAGDSRCVLGTNGGFKAMSEDHKPYDEGERKRIEDAGGSVQWKRVDGDLAVSRALGDFQYKGRTDLPPHSQKVKRISIICYYGPAPSRMRVAFAFVS
jgi:serine/threonine protein phosphatase PrpC